MIPMKFASMGGSGGSSFDPANPGAIGAGTPSTGAFTRLTVAQGTLTDPVTGLSLTATWNDAADTFRGLDIQITDTASAAGSTPFRIRGGAAGTTELFTVDKAGNVKAPLRMDLAIGSGGGEFRVTGDGVIASMLHSGLECFAISASSGTRRVLMTANAAFGWVSNTISAYAQTLDLILGRAAAATLQMGQNHATTPTAQRIQAHGVTTGTGAPMTIAGGSGSEGQGPVNFEGGQYNIDLTGLPTSDPGVPGRLWRSGTNLHIST